MNASNPECDLRTDPEPTPCASCQLTYKADGRDEPAPGTRLIAGRWYCLQHGMDIYCD